MTVTMQKTHASPVKPSALYPNTYTVLSNLQHCTPTLLLQYCQTFSTVSQHFYTVLSNLQHCTSTLLLQYCQTFSTVPQHFYCSTIKPSALYQHFYTVLSNLQFSTVPDTFTTVLSNLQHCTPTLLLQYCQTFSTVPTLLHSTVKPSALYLTLLLQYCQTFSTVPQHFYCSTVKPSALYFNTFTTVLSNLQHCTPTL